MDWVDGITDRFSLLGDDSARTMFSGLAKGSSSSCRMVKDYAYRLQNWR